MATDLPSSVEKYQRILQADPRSRIFIELARALLDGGAPERALEVCERGLEHHPDSVQARIVAGKALLALGRPDEAVERFEAAVAADPGPYAYDLAGEALVRAGLGLRALPLLDRATAQHPGDARLRHWLEEAKASIPSGGGQAPALQGESPTPTATPTPTPTSTSTSTSTGTADEELALPELTTSLALAPPPTVSEAAEALDSLLVDDREGPPILSPTPSPTGSLPLDLQLPAAEPGAGEAGTTPPVPPPLRRSATGAVPLPGPNPEQVTGILSLIPDLPQAPSGSEPVPLPGPRADPTRSGTFTVPAAGREASEADEAARTYEHELRAKLLAEQAARPSFWRRRGRMLLALGLVIAVGGGAATFLVVRAHRRAAEARASSGDARKGLARDTAGALRAASRVLALVRAGPASTPEAEALAAEVDGLLAHDFGDADARGRARELLASGRAGAGELTARYLVAERGAERDVSEALIAGASQPGASPLAQALAGELLLSRHDRERARPLLEQAARAQPPMLRAVAALGDLEAQRGDLDAALDRYEVVLRAQATHPHAAMGAAEVRLRRGRDLPRALASLEAVTADRDSPPALQDRLRFDLVLARLLAAAGRTGDAERLLTATAARDPAEPKVAAAQAEVMARAGELDRALRAAEGASKLAPADPAYRELLARLQLERGLYRQLLASTGDAPTRALRIDRGIARLALGEPAAARGELEATRRDGKTSPEAAAWMALADLASGRRAEAAAIVAALLAAPSPHPVALLARARLDLSEGHLAEAEQHLRAAVERDPDLADARCELGRVLRARGRLTEAREALEQAVARHPYHVPSRIELGRTRLVVGDAPGAVRDLTAALTERPDDRDALVALAQAELSLGHLDQARRAGEHALTADPKSGPGALVAGQTAAAQGDIAAARRHLTRAVALLGRTREGLEARRALGSLKKRR